MEFLRYPHLITTFFNRCVFGPPKPFTVPSTWTWIGHPVSGLLSLTLPPSSDLVSLRLHTLLVFNLASNCNSPDRSTKSTPSVSLWLFVSTGFQVLFHSPPGVLFTFPSQYSSLSVTKEYLAFGGGPPFFPPDFSCPAVLWILLGPLWVRLRGFHPVSPVFPVPFCSLPCSSLAVLTPFCFHQGLGSFRFARRYFGNRCFFLFLRLLRCFSSPSSPPWTIFFLQG